VASSNSSLGQAVLGDHEVHVLFAEVVLDDPVVESSHLSMLPADERERARHFHRAVDQHRFVARRVLLRRTLERYTGIDAASMRFSYSEHGKPALDNDAEIRFSVSHSQAHVAIAVSRRREVGVDIEHLRELSNPAAIIREFLSPAALGVWLAHPPRDRQDVFFGWWTCLEALGKAKGSGIRAPCRLDLDVLDAIARYAPTPHPIRADGKGSSYAAFAFRLPLGLRATVVAEGTDWHVRMIPGFAEGHSPTRPPRAGPRSHSPDRRECLSPDRVG
jgi:4'-phosphopantetheinyl transferase